MNIIVTGATGFVGRHLVPKLRTLGHSVMEYDSKTLNRLRIVEGLQPVDYIIHLAVKTAAGGYCQTHSGDQYLINSEINSLVMNTWKKDFPKAKMITFGSSCSYDKNIVKTEDNYLRGEVETGYEVYGNVKRNLLIGLKAMKQQFGMNYSFLIPSVFYGPNYELDDKHFIFDLIRKIVNAKNGGDEVVLWGDGTQTRELIFIDDAVDIIIKAMEWDLDIVNLSSGKEHPIHEYAKAICNIVGYDSSNINYDITKFVGSKSKNLINTHLTDFEFTSLEEGLKQTITYYENRISSSK
jgi:GDP-L-fucose synthase|tara:strand:- start:4132 stop:5016 length:885 start_codon:yes stop_codon:yes gene_type:complete